MKDRREVFPFLFFPLFHAETLERAGLWKLWMENTSFPVLYVKRWWELWEGSRWRSTYVRPTASLPMRVCHVSFATLYQASNIKSIHPMLSIICQENTGLTIGGPWLIQPGFQQIPLLKLLSAQSVGHMYLPGNWKTTWSTTHSQQAGRWHTLVLSVQKLKERYT